MDYEMNENDVTRTLEIIISSFKEKEAKVNDLNVFPVPDGDTGTNMLLTLKSVQQELSGIDSFTVKNLGDKISYGALMGARGNSGVILSQILKGFFDELVQKKDFSLTALKNAVKSSMELAYSSVQNPTEGTMLTTIKDIYKTVESLDGKPYSVMDLLDLIINETEKSVLRTTFLLPVLKQAGVVDAGAQGLLEILIGLKKALINIYSSGSSNNPAAKKGQPGNRKNNRKDMDNIIPDLSHDIQPKSPADVLPSEESAESASLKKMKLISEIKNIYCTEFMIKGENINIARLREDVESFGDSALVVGNDRLVKVHVHSNFPNRVLQRALKEGTLHDIQINNMIDQSKQAIAVEIPEEIELPKKEYGLIAIANGDGFEEIFKSIGTDYIIKGGQSMNPSTYEIVKAINKLDCEKIILFPNNKNIILTANQAKKIVKRNISVVGTTTIPQGISAVLAFNPDAGLEENLENMNRAIGYVRTGEITVAVRDANLYVGEIKKGAYIGLANGKVKVISESLADSVIELVRDMVTGNEEVITFYCGEGTGTELNQEIQEKLHKLFPKLEIEYHLGGQPLYPYIFSIE